MTTIYCVHCGTPLTINAGSLAGQVHACPSCGGSISDPTPFAPGPRPVARRRRNDSLWMVLVGSAGLIVLIIAGVLLIDEVRAQRAEKIFDRVEQQHQKTLDTIERNSAKLKQAADKRGR